MFDSLPGIFDFKVDGNLGLLPANGNPIVLVLGTASKGRADAVVTAARTSSAIRTFGASGTLARGALEAAAGGALNVRLMRIGAKPASLANIGAGYTVTTGEKDGDAGTDYLIYWDDTNQRLQITRASDLTVVYDNDPTVPVDLNEVSVSATAGVETVAATGTITTVAVANFNAAATGTLTDIAFVDSNPDTITRLSGSFITDGFAVGMKISVSGSASNDGTYTLAGVGALTLTLDAGDALTPESAGASVDIDCYDGERLSLDDGNHTPTVFEFDVQGDGIGPGVIGIDLSALTSANDVRDAIIAAINNVGNLLDITASSGGAGVVNLVNDVAGVAGNVAIQETVKHASFTVTGMAGGGPAATGDIGTLTVPLTLEDADGVNGAVFTAGSDGIDISRMELWEALYAAYKLLDDVDVDYLVPMNAYLDDLNTEDLDDGDLDLLNTNPPWESTPVYPTAGSSYDALGKVFVQEFEGQLYFWWDMNRDDAAEIFPSVGDSDATHDAFGTALGSGDFHEVNFAYDLARFCFDKSENNAEVIGFVGVRPPRTFSLADVSAWVGTAPISELDGDNLVITTNGTGLLGNKFMAGRITSGSLAGLEIGGIDGLAGGGFYAKEDPFLDGGADLKDTNDALVDLGKYISLVGAQLILANTAQKNAYVSTASSVYAGFVSSLPAESAPTNKVLPGARVPFRLSLAKLDSLAGAGYVMVQPKTKGTVVSDAPTAARTTSDYRRLSTVRIVKATLDAIRSVAEPFLGEGLSGARLAALDTALENTLAKLLKAGLLKRYQKKLSATASDLVLGKATVELTLVPSYELRSITVLCSLAAQ